MNTYKVSKSKNKGRNTWSINFYHPMIREKNTGKPVRVRRGTGISSEEELENLILEVERLIVDVRSWKFNKTLDSDKAKEIFYTFNLSNNSYMIEVEGMYVSVIVDGLEINLNSVRYLNSLGKHGIYLNKLLFNCLLKHLNIVIDEELIRDCVTEFLKNNYLDEIDLLNTELLEIKTGTGLFKVELETDSLEIVDLVMDSKHKVDREEELMIFLKSNLK